MARRFGDTEALYSWLLGFVNVEKGQKTEFKLDRMRALCERLKEPQSSYEVVHVAGSKGKGSVSAMIARCLQATGLTTGLYTSPHLLRWKERISLAGDEMPEELVLDAAEELLPLVEGRRGGDFPGGELPTYFELTTLIAFCAFRLAGCERAVVEVGLGGRLDSTNVVNPKASVITPIELEHTEWLGDTITQIAGEKAGIIKPSRPCYLSSQSPEARDVFVRVCAERRSPLREAPSLARISDLSIDARGTRARLDFEGGSILSSRFPAGLELRTPMIGAVQAENMALALLAAAELEATLGAEAAAQGMARAFLPARFQVLEASPPVVLDGAHTPNSVRRSWETCERLFPGPKALLFACAEDKKHGEMAEILGRNFDRITLTRPGVFKKGDLSALASSFKKAEAAFRVVEDHVEAIGRARSEAAALGIPLLVIGSFYLCAEFARLSGEDPAIPPQR